MDGEKISRRFEIVRNFRPATEKTPKRFQIGLDDNVFKDSRCRSVEKPDEKQNVEPSPASFPESKKGIGIELSRTDFVGLAVIAGLALGYLIGKSRR